MAALKLESNLKPLGICWLVLSAFHLVPGLFLFVFSSAITHYAGPDVPLFVPGLLHLVAILLSAGAILGLITGYGLLTWKPWARMLAIVLGIFHLLSFPFGTALGIYTLWVLLPVDSEREYRQRSLVTA